MTSLKPLGIRLLTPRLDIRDQLACGTERAWEFSESKRGEQFSSRSVSTGIIPLLICARRNDQPLAHLTLRKTQSSIAEIHLAPAKFAQSDLAREALIALNKIIGRRRKPDLVFADYDLAGSLWNAHFAHESNIQTAHKVDAFQNVNERLQTLGIDSNYGRQRNLEPVREPTSLQLIGADYSGRPFWLIANAGVAWKKMQTAAQQDSVLLEAVSGFRSIGYQVALIQRKLDKGQSIEEVLSVLAAPGFSEHHSGRALDIGTPGCAPAEEAFEKTSAFEWLQKYAAGFGFRLSFPRNNPHGINYEPWHWYFVG